MTSNKNDVEIGDTIVAVQFNDHKSKGVYRGRSNQFPNKIVIEALDNTNGKTYHYLIEEQDIRTIKRCYE